MAEIINYKGRSVHIGTCENLYYVSYQKYIAALSGGFLKGLSGNGMPMDYVKVRNGFRFRFPFPDEDQLKFGEIIEPFYRGIPIIVSSSLINEDSKPGNENVQIEIIQQMPLHKESDGEIYLALVFRDPRNGKPHSIRGDEGARRIVADLIRNHIINESDIAKKKFYKTIAVRILKGYGLKVLYEYKKAVNEVRDLPRQINKRNKRGI